MKREALWGKEVFNGMILLKFPLIYVTIGRFCPLHGTESEKLFNYPRFISHYTFCSKTLKKSGAVLIIRPSINFYYFCNQKLVELNISNSIRNLEEEHL